MTSDGMKAFRVDQDANNSMLNRILKEPREMALASGKAFIYDR